MDLTPEAAIYRACAEASWEAPGTQRLWRSYQRDTYLELMLARPDFCALVDVAYRAGREDAAKAIEVVDTTSDALCWPHCDQMNHQEEFARIARGGQQPRTPDADVAADINELPDWERELLERQAQEMERGSE